MHYYTSALDQTGAGGPSPGLEEGSATAELDRWRVDFDSPRPIYLQIIDEVKRAVARGALRPGDRLPSQRELAQSLRVNPNTVQRAFREMEVMGLVETVRGEGTFVRADPGRLKRLREELAASAVRQFVQEVRALGLEEAEVLALVRAALKGEEVAPWASSRP